MTLVNVSELMTDPEFTETLTRKRPTVALSHEGEASTTYATATITAIVQPGKPSEAKYLEEGARIDNMITLYVLPSVISGGDGALTISDIVVYAGSNYRVVSVEHYESGGYQVARASNYVKGSA